ACCRYRPGPDKSQFQPAGAGALQRVGGHEQMDLLVRIGFIPPSPTERGLDPYQRSRPLPTVRFTEILNCIGPMLPGCRSQAVDSKPLHPLFRPLQVSREVKKPATAHTECFEAASTVEHSPRFKRNDRLPI